jgi:hypothetical protein
MARRGRKPTGTNLVERLEGSERAKIRLKAILETLSGERSIPEVCQELGIQESMFHRVRGEVLQTALDRLEPRPLGRRPQEILPQDLRVAELEEDNLRLQMELKTTEVRRELAEKLPRLGKQQANNAAHDHASMAPAQKKTTARRRKRRQRLQQNTNPPSE